MRECRPCYSMAQICAVVYEHFVIRDGPPAIDAQGRPVYRLADAVGFVAAGCAVYEISKALAPEFVEGLNAIPFHETCEAGRLESEHRIGLSTLLCDATPEFAGIFFAAVQQIHDRAAIAWFNDVTAGEARRRADFKREIAAQLEWCFMTQERLDEYRALIRKRWALAVTPNPAHAGELVAV